MKPYLGEDLHKLLFNDDHKKHCEGMETLTKGVQTNPDEIVSIVDLSPHALSTSCVLTRRSYSAVLRYSAWRLMGDKTTTLLA